MRIAPGPAPELSVSCLTGRVENHPRHAPGKIVTTSVITGKSGELVFTKSGSLYELGDANPRYEQQFPNARCRLLAALQEFD